MEEEKAVVNYQNLEELANKLNIDYNNQDEMKSIQLALQLQAEEQAEFSNNIHRINFNALMNYITQQEANTAAEVIEEENEEENFNENVFLIWITLK